jgi:beta-mannanase
MQAGQSAQASSPAAWPRQEGRVRLGVTTRALATNATTPWAPGDLGEVNRFEHAVRAHAGIVQWFADWRRPLDLAQLRAVAARGSVPQITWEPWDRSVGAYKPQPRYTLRAIYEGRHDAYVRDFARGLARYGGRVLLRFGHEMNGEWYSWAEDANGNRPGDFVRAWRHVHDIFRAEGARNVRWVWCPVTRPVRPSQYPGHEYVDVVGLAGFNGGTKLPWGGWRTFETIFDAQLQSLRRIAPGKPVQISEVSTVEEGGDKAAWIAAMFAYVERNEWIDSVLWFEVEKQGDWRVTTSPGAQRAFAAGAGRLLRPVPPGDLARLPRLRATPLP